MSGMTDVVRFFRVVSPVHPLMLGAFGLAVVAAAVVFVFAADLPQKRGALIPILLLQMLATSSGFAGPARRGHYDLLLTTGHGRFQIGVVHWAMSVAPGVAAWTTAAVVELISGRGYADVALATGTMAAMFLVSTLPWALNVRLPRLTTGLAWILLFVLLVSMLPQGAGVALEADVGGGDTPVLAAALVCPWVLAGRELAPHDVIPVAVAAVIALAGMAASLRWIIGADLPLEAAQ